MDSTISHTSPCVSVKSTITIYISGVCVSSVSGKKTGYEKKREGPRSKVYTSVCVWYFLWFWFWFGTAHNALVGYHGTVVKDICGSNN